MRIMGFPNGECASNSSNRANVSVRLCVNSCESDNEQTNRGAAANSVTTQRNNGISETSSVTQSVNRHPSAHHNIGHNTTANVEQTTATNGQIRDQLSASDVRRTVRGLWSFDCASFFACFFCCINMYNLSRFSILTYFFKGPFLLQFLILSIGFGLPFLLLMMSIGQYLGSGFYDMWFISPAFKGIGAAFLLTYVVYGIYSSVPIAWLFVYFRDSLVAGGDSAYKWAFCNTKYATNNCLLSLNSSSYEYLGWSVSSYFHGKVLDKNQRQLNSKEIKIEVSFHLFIVWILICLSLGRGIHASGKLLFVAAIVPIVMYCMVVLRFVEQWGDGVNTIFQTTGQPFLLDSMSWLMAARESFTIWVAFSAIALNIHSHNRSTHNIMRQILVLFVLVFTLLVLSSCFLASCIKTLKNKGLIYFPSSYEEMTANTFVRAIGPNAKNSDVKVVSASNLILGENLVTYADMGSSLSHYQVMRFATEIFPTSVAIEGSRNVGSVWTIMFYLSAIIFSFGHLIVVWGTVIDSLVAISPYLFKLCRPLIAFITCVIAFTTALSMASNSGISIIYFMDYCVGSLWWLALLYLLLLIAVLIIRGRPCGTENLVSMLTKDVHTRSWLLPILTFQWNLIMPIATMILSIAFTRSYNTSGLTWTQLVTYYTYWPEWVKCLSTILQITPLFLVFLIGTIQMFRYLFPSRSSSPLFHERIQALFCPIITTVNNSESSGASGVTNVSYIPDDPPPKYEPPPSYSSATARHLVNQLRGRLASSANINLHFLNHRSNANQTEFTANSSFSDLSKQIGAKPEEVVIQT